MEHDKAEPVSYVPSYIPSDGRREVIAELLKSGWLRKVEWYDRVDSTNTRARQLLTTDQLARPALLVADEQTSGRGRSSRSWWSPQGCLMFTLVVDSSTFLHEATDQTPLALLCGVAMAEAVSQVLDSQLCQLKWPNDLYLNGKKLAGILIESLRSASSQSEPTWIIGVGLNVDIPWQLAPDEIRSRATCLSQFAGSRQRAEDVLIVVIEQIQRWFEGNRLQSQHWLAGWSERCLLTGKKICVRQTSPSTAAENPIVIEGRCEGVDKLGRLLVRQTGELKALSFGEVASWSH